MNIYERMGITSNAAIVIISIGIMLFLDFLMTRVTKKLKLPNVTAYIVAGILIGPYVFNLIPKQVISGMDFLADIAFSFYSFFNWRIFFKLSLIKKNGPKVVVITVFESLIASILVFIVTYYLFKLSLSFSIVLGALAAATAQLQL